MGSKKVFSGQRGLITAIFLASVFINLLVLTAPLYMLQLFSRVMSSGNVNTMIMLTIGAAIALIFFLAFDTIRQRLAARLGTRLEGNHGPSVLHGLVTATNPNDTQGARPVRDLQEIRAFVNSAAFIALLDAPWSLLFVGVIFLFHPVLGIIATIGLLFLFGLGIISELVSREPTEAASDAEQKASGTIEEMLRNAEVVRSMGKAPALIQRWKKETFVAMVFGAVATDRIALLTSFAKMTRMALQIALLGGGVLLVIQGQLSPGMMIASSILLGRAAAPVEQSIAGWRQFSQARLAMRRLNALFASQKEAAQTMDLPEPNARLSVENATVVVANKQAPLLLDVSFELRPGDALGIIGPSGAGKTSLARALVGLQPLSRGYIRVDDAALTDWPVDQIGQYIGFLPQRVELFQGTVAENIAMMDEEASPSAVVEAAKRASIHELILSLPAGYNTQVGLRGELLSAGQRQRIGLARAFFGDRRIIVMDEPNANLDPDGEEALSQAVQNATDRGCIVILITHRMSILRGVSHAGIMQDGRMVRFGASKSVLDSMVSPLSNKTTDDPKVAVLKPRKIIKRTVKTGGAK
ncbi:type I secretion system permease/ATPase [Neptunicoccus cionae]|uniref:Peptide ABC transporter n=1 Tax=Neptunicoccus cionae TaxID=2035344 RepID=A0A916QUC6_9RHOB|nr:type I secretion system permease/ATPase [Amylibacter cionae]GGA12403.1 peptide ABC transporter [Amylibacter cionae]